MEIVFEKHELCNTRRNSPRGGTSSSCRYEWCSRSNRTTALRWASSEPVPYSAVYTNLNLGHVVHWKLGHSKAFVFDVSYSAVKRVTQ